MKIYKISHKKSIGLYGALAVSFSFQKQIKIIHLEAGLRSFDKTMPEEINRQIIDQISDVLLVPTQFDYKNLKKENLIKGKEVYVIGNTITDIIKTSLRKIRYFGVFP
jgi:UDP-N-acetylglucosamine 2-epimerase (non-hydrolysing)